MKKGVVILSLILIIGLSVSAEAISFTEFVDKVIDFFKGTPTGAQIALSGVDSATFGGYTLPVPGVSTAVSADLVSYSQATYSAASYTVTILVAPLAPATITVDTLAGDTIGTFTIPAGTLGLNVFPITLAATPFTSVGGTSNARVTYTAGVGAITVAAGSSLSLTPIVPAAAAATGGGGGGGGPPAQPFTTGWDTIIPNPCGPAPIAIDMTNVQWVYNSPNEWFKRRDTFRIISYNDNGVSGGEKVASNIFGFNQQGDTTAIIPGSETWDKTNMHFVIQTGYNPTFKGQPTIEKTLTINCPAEEFVAPTTEVPIAPTPVTEPVQPPITEPTKDTTPPEFIVPIDPNPYVDEMQQWFDDGGKTTIPQEWEPFIEDFLSGQTLPIGCFTWTVKGNCNYFSYWQERFANDPKILDIIDKNKKLGIPVPRQMVVDIIYTRCSPPTTTTSKLGEAYQCPAESIGQPYTPPTGTLPVGIYGPPLPEKEETEEPETEEGFTDTLNDILDLTTEFIEDSLGYIFPVTPQDQPEEVIQPPITPIIPIEGSCPGCPAICGPPAPIPLPPQPDIPEEPNDDGGGGGGGDDPSPFWAPTDSPYYPVENCGGPVCLPACNNPEQFEDHVLISEVFASETQPNYIELTNPTPVPIDISGYKITNAISDDYSEGNFILTIPAETTLEPGQYLVIALSDDTAYEETFGISPDIEFSADNDDVPNLEIIKTPIQPYQSPQIKITANTATLTGIIQNTFGITGAQVTEFIIEEDEETKIKTKEGELIYTSGLRGILVYKEGTRQYIVDKNTGEQKTVNLQRQPGHKIIYDENGQTLYEHKVNTIIEQQGTTKVVRDAQTGEIIEFVYLIDPTRPDETWNYEYGDIIDIETRNINGQDTEVYHELRGTTINIRDAQTGTLLATLPDNTPQPMSKRNGISLPEQGLTLVLFTGEGNNAKDVDILRINQGHAIYKNEKDTKPEEQHEMYNEEDWTPQKIPGFEDKTNEEINELVNAEVQDPAALINLQSALTIAVQAADPAFQATQPTKQMFRTWNRIDMKEGGEKKPQGTQPTINESAFEKGKPTFQECNEYLGYDVFPDRDLSTELYELLKEFNPQIDKKTKYQTCQQMYGVIAQCNLPPQQRKTPAILGETTGLAFEEETPGLQIALQEETQLNDGFEEQISESGQELIEEQPVSILTGAVTHEQIATTQLSPPSTQISNTETTNADVLTTGIATTQLQAPIELSETEQKINEFCALFDTPAIDITATIIAYNTFDISYGNNQKVQVNQFPNSQVYFTKATKDTPKDNPELPAYTVEKKTTKDTTTDYYPTKADNYKYEAYDIAERTPLARDKTDSVSVKTSGEITTTQQITGQFIDITGAQIAQLQRFNGNGITGHDETSEHFEKTWVLSLASPGIGPDQVYVAPTYPTCTQSINQYAESPIPEGYRGEEPAQPLIAPVTLPCTSTTITMNVPADAQNVNAYRCRDDECYTVPIVTEATMTCADQTMTEIIGYDYQTQSPEPEQFQQKQDTLTPQQNTFENGGKIVRLNDINGEIPITMAPVQSAPLPPNPYLTIVGGPIELEMQPVKTSAEITLPYKLPPGYDPHSVAGFIWDTDKWKYLDGTIYPTDEMVKFTIDDVSKYNNNGKIMLSVIANWCTNCEERYDKVYDNGDNAIVLVHGITTAPQTWKYLVNDLITLNHQAQVWTYGYPMTRSLEESGKSLALFLQQNNFGFIEIVAHGSGGTVVHEAIKYAKENGMNLPVDKIILAGSTTQPLVNSDLYNNIFTDLTNKKTLTTMTNLNSRAILDTLDGTDAQKQNGINYYSIAGTETLPENSQYFIHTQEGIPYEIENDGLVTVTAAATIGQQQGAICEEHYRLPLTHNDLITEVQGRQLIISLLAGIVGTPQPDNVKQVTIELPQCQAGDTLILTGNREPPIEYPLAQCGCGNGVCDIGEDITSCPEDCYISEEQQLCQDLKIPLLLASVALLVITIMSAYNSYKTRKHNQMIHPILYTLITIMGLIIGAYVIVCTIPTAPIILWALSLATVIYEVSRE